MGLGARGGGVTSELEDARPSLPPSDGRKFSNPPACGVEPALPSGEPGRFTIDDVLVFAGVPRRPA
jgi:hypothetical protein